VHGPGIQRWQYLLLPAKLDHSFSGDCGFAALYLDPKRTLPDQANVVSNSELLERQQ
jgi:hypothetical protein